MITNPDTRHDYFTYKIGHFENETGSKYISKKIQEYQPITAWQSHRCDNISFSRLKHNYIRVPPKKYNIMQG